MSTAVNPSNHDSSEETAAAGRDGSSRPEDHRTEDDRPEDDGVAPAPLTRKEVVAREKARFGGMRLGAAFFGWLAAAGMAVLLTVMIGGGAAALGVSPSPGAVQTLGIVGAVVLLVITVVAYFCGGYVAGRMARFNGAKQGLAVWLWALLVSVVFGVLGAIAGVRLNFLPNPERLPGIPVDSDTVTTAGVITLCALTLAALASAVIGGMSGMRFHRRVDKAGLGR